MSVREHLLAARRELEETLEAVNQGLSKLDDVERLQAAINRALSTLDAGKSVVATSPRATVRTRIKGSRGLPDILRELFTDHMGQPLTVADILSRASDKGYVTESEDPINTVDLQIYKLKAKGWPLEKSGPRTWTLREPIPA